MSEPGDPFVPGDQVLVKWWEEDWYPAVVVRQQGEQCYVIHFKWYDHYTKEDKKNMWRVCRETEICRLKACHKKIQYSLGNRIGKKGTIRCYYPEGLIVGSDKIRGSELTLETSDEEADTPTLSEAESEEVNDVLPNLEFVYDFSVHTDFRHQRDVLEKSNLPKLVNAYFHSKHPVVDMSPRYGLDVRCNGKKSHEQFLPDRKWTVGKLIHELIRKEYHVLQIKSQIGLQRFWSGMPKCHQDGFWDADLASITDFPFFPGFEIAPSNYTAEELATCGEWTEAKLPFSLLFLWENTQGKMRFYLFACARKKKAAKKPVAKETKRRDGK